MENQETFCSCPNTSLLDQMSKFKEVQSESDVYNYSAYYHCSVSCILREVSSQLAFLLELVTLDPINLLSQFRSHAHIGRH